MEGDLSIGGERIDRADPDGVDNTAPSPSSATERPTGVAEAYSDVDIATVARRTGGYSAAISSVSPLSA